MDKIASNLTQCKTHDLRRTGISYLPDSPSCASAVVFRNFRKFFFRGGVRVDRYLQRGTSSSFCGLEIFNSLLFPQTSTVPRCLLGGTRRPLRSLGDAVRSPDVCVNKILIQGKKTHKIMTGGTLFCGVAASAVEYTFVEL